MLAVLIVAFVIAMVLMFVHPTGSLMIFFLGLVCALVGGGVVHVMARAEQTAIRHALQRRECPHCGATGGPLEGGAGEWQCRSCGEMFVDTGAKKP